MLLSCIFCLAASRASDGSSRVVNNFTDDKMAPWLHQASVNITVDTERHRINVNGKNALCVFFVLSFGIPLRFKRIDFQFVKTNMCAVSTNAMVFQISGKVALTS